MSALKDQFKDWMSIPAKVEAKIDLLIMRVANLGDAISGLRDQIDRTTLARSSDGEIVIWGKTVNGFKNDELEWRDVVFSLRCNIVLGVRQRLVFQPQARFMMQRWLLLGDSTLRVSDVCVGHETCIPGSLAMAGIAGRAGDGTFPIAEIGTSIAFEVSSS